MGCYGLDDHGTWLDGRQAQSPSGVAHALSTYGLVLAMTRTTTGCSVSQTARAGSASGSRVAIAIDERGQVQARRRRIEAGTAPGQVAPTWQGWAPVRIGDGRETGVHLGGLHDWA